MLDGKAAMDRFLKLIATEPDISRVPITVSYTHLDVYKRQFIYKVLKEQTEEGFPMTG